MEDFSSTEVNKKIETIGEKHYLNEMPLASFEKYNSKYQEEKYKIAKDLEECSLNISNLDESLQDATGCIKPFFNEKK